eukprot:TRINITY_DN4392_c2_g1_i1.p1 TRINITY_DN4392_c2_g1~~TRINITY_DN4392_c2_g1_i1.p1  ORF type:complete len:845 (-),score=153.35 TRINITY_DN4392_c2_g1_i1:137-2671(-)
MPSSSSSGTFESPPRSLSGRIDNDVSAGASSSRIKVSMRNASKEKTVSILPSAEFLDGIAGSPIEADKLQDEETLAQLDRPTRRASTGDCLLDVDREWMAELAMGKAQTEREELLDYEDFAPDQITVVPDKQVSSVSVTRPIYSGARRALPHIRRMSVGTLPQEEVSKAMKKEERMQHIRAMLLSIRAGSHKVIQKRHEKKRGLIMALQSFVVKEKLRRGLLENHGLEDCFEESLGVIFKEMEAMKVADYEPIRRSLERCFVDIYDFQALKGLQDALEAHLKELEVLSASTGDAIDHGLGLQRIIDEVTSVRTQLDYMRSFKSKPAESSATTTTKERLANVATDEEMSQEPGVVSPVSGFGLREQAEENLDDSIEEHGGAAVTSEHGQPPTPLDGQIASSPMRQNQTPKARTLLATVLGNDDAAERVKNMGKVALRRDVCRNIAKAEEAEMVRQRSGGSISEDSTHKWAPEKQAQLEPEMILKNEASIETLAEPSQDTGVGTTALLEDELPSFLHVSSDEESEIADGQLEELLQAAEEAAEDSSRCFSKRASEILKRKIGNHQSAPPSPVQAALQPAYLVDDEIASEAGIQNTPSHRGPMQYTMPSQQSSRAESEAAELPAEAKPPPAVKDGKRRPRPRLRALKSKIVVETTPEERWRSGLALRPKMPSMPDTWRDKPGLDPCRIYPTQPRKQPPLFEPVSEPAFTHMRRGNKQAAGIVELEDICSDRKQRTQAFSTPAPEDTPRLPRLELLPLLPRAPSPASSNRASSKVSPPGYLFLSEESTRGVQKPSQPVRKNNLKRKASTLGGMILKHHVDLRESAATALRPAKALSGLVSLTLKSRGL